MQNAVIVVGKHLFYLNFIAVRAEASWIQLIESKRVFMIVCA